ncbi:MAG: tetratricopeptide repeat protein, partial [Leptospira sp.]|nr:tetratricopeptide repeat protein [Leptospira sp.]
MDFQKGVRFYFCNRMPGYSKNLYKTLAIILLTFAFSSPLLSGIKEAKKAYSQKQFQKAIKLFKEYSEEHPMDGESYMYMGYIYESQKDFPKSIQMFRRAVDLNLDRKHKETSYLKIVLYYNYHQEWDLLVHYANRLLKLNPKQKEVVKMRERGLTNRGNTVYVSPSSQKEKAYSVKEDKDPEKGIHYFEKALAENPEDEDIHWELSTLYFKNENFIKADAMIQWLINKKPTNKNYLYKGGMAKLRLGAFQEAIDLFEEARNNTTEKDAKLLYFINLNEGLAYHKLKNLAVAAKFYRKALALQKTPAPLIALTKLKYEAGDYQNCIGTADQVLDMSPGENEALLYKALSLLKLGNKKEGYSLLINFGRILKRAYSDLNEAPEKYHDGFLKLARFYTNRKKYKVALSYFDAISKTRNQT